MATNNPFMDPAKPILDADAMLDEGQRADLWQAFHGHGTDISGLIGYLGQRSDVSNETKAALVDAKQKSLQPPPDASSLDRAVHAITKLREIPSEALDFAEENPKAAQAAVKAAQVKRANRRS